LPRFAVVGGWSLGAGHDDESSAKQDTIKVLIIDGQNNHNWRATSPVLKSHLEATKLFSVEVATSPEQGSEGFAPKFSDYDVVVMNYNGDDWSPETQRDFETFVESGGGLVIYHAADNSFPGWKAYNEMIGLGGWGGRNEKDGPYIRYRDGQIVRDTSPGGGGSHGAQHAYVVEHIDTEHPVTKGLPAKWLHVSDELYDRLRGPANNLHVLAVAYSDKKTGGTGENEPVLFTIEYGKGRVFHTVLGHDVSQIQCVGFAVTFQRGTEWAATGKVTQPLPAEFPTESDVLSLR
jgi:type 1 glutamine amidotransferase